MTTSRPRPTSRVARMLTVPAAVVLGVGTLGCGIIDTVQNAVDTASTLSGFADRLGKASQLTYTARYKLTGDEGGTVTLVQSPPKSAIISGTNRLIFTPEHMITCDGKQCQQAPNAAGAVGATDAGLVAGVAGPGFVTPELALGLVAAAALVPGSDVSTSEKTYAGQKALCADVTGVKDPNASAGPDGKPDEMLQDFSVCVTEAGVLAAFDGRSNTGERIAIELVDFSDQASAKAFTPPAGAEVVDVAQLPNG